MIYKYLEDLGENTMDLTTVKKAATRLYLVLSEIQRRQSTRCSKRK